jgi:hypothetical protein
MGIAESFRGGRRFRRHVVSDASRFQKTKSRRDAPCEPAWYQEIDGARARGAKRPGVVDAANRSEAKNEGAQAVTLQERLQRIETLRDENAEARDRLARQEREREEDPARMQDHLLAADVRETFTPGDLMFTAPTSDEDAAEPAGGRYVRRTDSRGMIYKVGPENEPAPASPGGGAPFSEEDGSWAAWNAWLRGHLDIERGVVAKAMGTVVAEMRKEWHHDLVERDRRIAELVAENLEIKAMLADVLKHCDQGTRAIAKLAHDVVAETRDRQALFDALENNFTELRAYMRGVARDWISTS